VSVLVGLDVGTSGARAVAVDESGGVVAEASSEYPLMSPRPGWTEQDPEDWWRGAKEALGKVTVGVDDEVIGLGLTVAIDKRNRRNREEPQWQSGDFEQPRTRATIRL
jgi:xylulokinase